MSQRLGDYTIVRELGRGGFGVVYEALEQPLGRRVALKVYHVAFALDAQQRERFLREARIAARLDHPHVLPVYRIGDFDGTPYLAMAHVDGISLEHVIDALRPLDLATIRRSTFLAAVAAALAGRDATAELATPPVSADGDCNHADAAIRIVLQAAEALGSAHAAGVFHRDVKPANLLLRRDGHLFLSDFGLARDETLATLTRSGEFQGTPHYMSPEQTLADRRQVDHRTDVYSLGATLYALLTLQPPHAGNSAAEVARSIVLRDPLPPSQRNERVPHDLDLVVAKAMQRDPADRYQTMSEFADDLRRFLAHEAVLARPLGWRRRLVRLVRQQPRRQVALFAAVLLCAFAIWGALVGRQAEQAANAGVARDKADREARAIGTLRAHLDAGRLLDAARFALSAAPNLDGATWRAAVADLRERVATEARSLVERAAQRPLSATPQELVAQGRLARALSTLGSDALGEVPGLASTLTWLEQVESALATHPVAPRIFDADVEVAIESLEAVIAVAAQDDPSAFSAWAKLGEVETSLQPGKDFRVLHAGWSLDLGTRPVRFVGYAIDSANPAWHDFDGVDVRGAAALCLRYCPQYERDDGLFGKADVRASVSALIAKARAAHAAGASLLLVVNPPDGRPDNWSEASFDHGAEAPPLPIVQMTRPVVDTWLRHGEFDLATVAQKMAEQLRPCSVDLAGLSLRCREGLGEEALSVRLAPLAPFLVGALSANTASASKKGLQALRLILASMLPGPDSDEALRAALRGTNESLRQLALYALRARPRSALTDELALLARQGSFSKARELYQLAPQIPDAVRSGRYWYQVDDRYSLRPSPLTIHDDESEAGLALAALWRGDREEGLRIAKEMVNRGEWMAAAILRQERPKDLAELLKIALVKVTAQPDVERNTMFTAVVGCGLLELRDPAGLEPLRCLVAAWAESPISYDLDDVVKALGAFPSPVGAEEMLSCVLAPMAAGERTGNIRQEAIVALSAEPRRSVVQTLIAAKLRAADAPTQLACLDLLDRIGATVDGDLAAAVGALASDGQSRVRDAAMALAAPPFTRALRSLRECLDGAVSEQRVVGAVELLAAGKEPWSAEQVGMLVALLADGLAAKLRSVWVPLPDDRSRSTSAQAAIYGIASRPAHQPLLKAAVEDQLRRGSASQQRQLLEFVRTRSPQMRAAMAPIAQELLLAPDAQARAMALELCATWNETVQAATVAGLADRDEHALAMTLRACLMAPWRESALLTPTVVAAIGAMPVGERVAIELLQRLDEVPAKNFVPTATAALLPWAKRLAPGSPQLARAANGFAWSLADWDRPVPGAAPLAITIAELAVASAPRTPGYLDTLASAQFAAGDPARAAVTMTAAIDCLPTNEKDQRTRFVDRRDRLQRAKEGAK